MADSAINAYVIEFGSNIMLRVQQKASKMLGKTMTKMAVVGKEFTQERISKWDMEDKTQGVSETPLGDPGLDRRTCRMDTSRGAKQFARDENLKTKVDVYSQWVKSASGAIGRKIDSVIWTALGGDAYAGDKGQTVVALPAGQKLATLAGEKLDTDFVIKVKTLLDENDVDADNRRVMIRPADLNDLLLDESLNTFDKNSIKALVKGEVGEWGGFTWIPTTEAVQGTCYFFQEDAVVFGMNESPFIEISDRADLSHAKQIYYELNVGAVRLEEEGVVEVTITPAA